MSQQTRKILLSVLAVCGLVCTLIGPRSFANFDPDPSGPTAEQLTVAGLTVVSSQQKLRKPSMSDTIKASVYADNTFELYINGQLVAVDSIQFIPHNVISVDILPAYPMTIAVLAKDNADPDTGMEYANTNIGDAGFILKFGDGTVTNGSWKAKAFSHGPVDRNTKSPRVRSEVIPDDWYTVDFDDRSWNDAREFSQQDVDPKQPFFEHDFDGATFIWTDDIALDNTVVFRHRVESPPDGRARMDFRNLNNVVPESPPGGGGGRNRRK